MTDDEVAASALIGYDAVDSMEDGHAAIGAELGDGIAQLFAVGLLASGFASTAAGCYSGVVVLDGLIEVRAPLLVRRLATLVPALVVLGAGVDLTVALVLSQVVRSFGISFVLIPLVRLTSGRVVMGVHVNHRAVTTAAVLVAAAVIALNTAWISSDRAMSRSTPGDGTPQTQ
ncbi:divalent metal cation transporter [Actinosynnema sp. CA-299493]